MLFPIVALIVVEISGGQARVTSGRSGAESVPDIPEIRNQLIPTVGHPLKLVEDMTRVGPYSLEEFEECFLPRRRW